MKQYYTFFASVLCLLFATGSLRATTRKVLFIGNSYTYTNSMPSMLQSFAAAGGDTLVFDQSDPGGYTLQDHSTYAPTLAKITAQQWDIVVVQEQSELPSFPPLQVDTMVYPYAHILDSLVKANDSCTQTMFMMTWGHQNGDPANCVSYPVICTYEGMQQRLRESYLQMTQDNNAIVAPVGAAWKVVWDSFPAINLYQPDSSHPSVAGSYLQTCVLYASIFHKPALGCSYTGGLATTDARTLQRIADKVTLDSLAQWQQYGHYLCALFSTAIAGNTATFVNNSAIPATDYWTFGDGATATVANPTHTYTSAGIYVVAHTVTTACFTETITDTLYIGVTGIGKVTAAALPAVYASANGNGRVTFLTEGINTYDQLRVYDTKGSCVRTYQLHGANIADDLAPGFYMYVASASGRAERYMGKLAVY
jgi:hypothetical protein